MSIVDDTHHTITMDALDAGLHVLCEKPLAHNAKQAREMYDKAEKVGVRHMTFFTFRWSPLHRYLKELIDEGYVGFRYRHEPLARCPCPRFGIASVSSGS